MQKKIDSGFGWDTTTDDVLAGLDLTGKTAIVTGGYSGVGLAITRALAGAGASVVVPARRVGLAEEAVAGIPGVSVAALDLGSQESVAAFAAGFTGELDMIIASAGIMAAPLARTAEGWESHFAVNHLGHFALVNRLFPALREGARVVALSSNGHYHSGIRWEDPQFTQGYDKWAAYGQSKSANSLFAVHLDRLGVQAFAAHPGVIDSSNLSRHLPVAEQIAMGWLNEDGSPPAGWAFKSPSQGAATAVWAATSPQLNGLGGLYLENADVSEITTEFDFAAGGVMPHAVDPDEAARLWDLSAQLTGADIIRATR